MDLNLNEFQERESIVTPRLEQFSNDDHGGSIGTDVALYLGFPLLIRYYNTTTTPEYF